MTKTLQQIKDEYANEQGRDSLDEFFSWNELTHTGIDRMQYHHDKVAIRYAQEQNRELVEMLSLVCMDMEERGRAYGDIYTMCKSILERRKLHPKPLKIKNK